MQVKVRTKEGAKGIRDGMFVTCWIVVQEKADAVVVPFDVFIYRQNKPYVFVVDESKGVVEQREVLEGIPGHPLWLAFFSSAQSLPSFSLACWWFPA